MRIWTLHPQYLDAQGLVALWRETLLAQAVLKGQTRGYTHHPQLQRFKAAPNPLEAIAAYLQTVHANATARGYKFDAGKFHTTQNVPPVQATRGQVEYEWQHLRTKLQARSPAVFDSIAHIAEPEPHPLFTLVDGGIADWEITEPKKAKR